MSRSDSRAELNPQAAWINPSDPVHDCRGPVFGERRHPARSAPRCGLEWLLYGSAARTGRASGGLLQAHWGRWEERERRAGWSQCPQARHSRSRQPGVRWPSPLATRCRTFRDGWEARGHGHSRGPFVRTIDQDAPETGFEDEYPASRPVFQVAVFGAVVHNPKGRFVWKQRLRERVEQSSDILLKRKASNCY